MKLTLATDFEMDLDHTAKVWFRKHDESNRTINEPVAVVEINLRNDHTIRYTDLVGMSANAVSQAEMMLAAAKLIESFFTGEDAESVVLL